MSCLDNVKQDRLFNGAVPTAKVKTSNKVGR